MTQLNMLAKYDMSVIGLLYFSTGIASSYSCWQALSLACSGGWAWAWGWPNSFRSWWTCNGTALCRGTSKDRCRVGCTLFRAIEIAGCLIFLFSRFAGHTFSGSSSRIKIWTWVALPLILLVCFLSSFEMLYAAPFQRIKPWFGLIELVQDFAILLYRFLEGPQLPRFVKTHLLEFEILVAVGLADMKECFGVSLNHFIVGPWL